MSSRLFHNLRRAYPGLDAQYSPSLPVDKIGEIVKEQKGIIPIPRHPQAFFTDLDSKFLTHSLRKNPDGTPEQIVKLAPWQVLSWAWPGNLLFVKGSKMGVSTSTVLEDFQFCLLPENQGRDVIIAAPTEALAKDHIRTLKLAVFNSDKYRHFLIRSAEEAGFREEQTKTETIYIRNQYNPRANSRIMGLGASLAMTWSWKNVGRVHVSDGWRLAEGMSDEDQEEYFGGLSSRLANTGGSMKIETPPDGQQGWIWGLYQRIKKQGAARTWDEARRPGAWGLIEHNSWEAVDFGMIDRGWLTEQKKTLGDLLFSQLYEAAILAAGNQWYKEEWLKFENYQMDQ